MTLGPAVKFPLEKKDAATYETVQNTRFLPRCTSTNFTGAGYPKRNVGIIQDEVTRIHQA
jgi:hypothetical protein